MTKKNGRGCKTLSGEKNWNAKVSDKARAVIRRSRLSAMVLAHEYGVHVATIYKIRRAR